MEANDARDGSSLVTFYSKKIVFCSLRLSVVVYLAGIEKLFWQLGPVLVAAAVVGRWLF